MAIGKEFFELEGRIGYNFRDIKYLENALTHTSYANEQKKDGIIHISPFTCMPEIMSQNIFPSMRKDCDVPILALIMDEQTGRAGYITRLEAFVDLMRRKQRKAKQVTV